MNSIRLMGRVLMQVIYLKPDNDCIVRTDDFDSGNKKTTKVQEIHLRNFKTASVRERTCNFS